MCRKSCKRDKKKKGQQRIMGMAASQARLLTITARMHDVEYHFWLPTEFLHSEWTVPDIQHHACALLLLII